MDKKNKIYGLIVGIIFLISGIAKSLDVLTFSNLIIQYGFGILHFLAPIIVLTEVILGLLLVFQIQSKYAALICAMLTVIFTLAYTYGLFFNGIEDCGCFGKITFLNNSPVFTYIRNAVLCYLSVTVYLKDTNKGTMDNVVACTFIVVMSIVSFMSGYTYRTTEKNSFVLITDNPKPLNNTVLKEFITTSQDSTYLVFAFTYSCPVCLNSIENLKQYTSSGMVDRVIGLALGDFVAAKKFLTIFNPNFLVKSYPAEQLLRLTNIFPSAYYIKNDSVQLEIRGMLPCEYVLSQQLHNHASKL